VLYKKLSKLVLMSFMVLRLNLRYSQNHYKFR
jgi:hypothetical protein